MGNEDPAERGVGHPLIEEALAGRAERQGGSIHIPAGAEPGLLALRSGRTRAITHEEINQVQSLIQGNDFATLRQGEQRGQASLVGPAGNRLRTRRGGIACESFESPWRHVGERHLTDPNSTELVHALQGLDESWTTHPCRGMP